MIVSVAMLKKLAHKWSEDRVAELSAALAFYSLLSIGPLLLIAVAVAGIFFGKDAAEGQIEAQLASLIGKDGAKTIQDVIAASSATRSNIVALATGVVTLLLSASGVFGQLRESLNRIWQAEPVRNAPIRYYIKSRLLAFLMVFGIGGLLLVSLMLSAVLSTFGTFFDGVLPYQATLLELLNTGTSFVIVSLLFAMIYKILPDAKIAWRDVWLGACVSALLFTLGKHFIGLYLGSSAVGTTYGAAGSFILLALWVYYSAHILFLGAELAVVHKDSVPARS